MIYAPRFHRTMYQNYLQGFSIIIAATVCLLICTKHTAAAASCDGTG